jgi:hypothetical protein
MATIAQGALGFSCYTNQESIAALSPFPQFSNFQLSLKDCLKKIERDCESEQYDPDELNYNKLKADAFEEMKATKDFKDFYCINFEQSEVDFSSDRKCSTLSIQPKQKSCENLAPKEHEDYITITDECNSLLTEHLKPRLTTTVKDRFSSTLSEVLTNFKTLHKNNADVTRLLDQVSKTTNFDYRLTSFTAGARGTNEFDQCAEYNEDEVPVWCQSKHIIVPGGKVFLPKERLELILAHEVGHIINKTSHPNNKFDQLIDKLKKVNHKGSKKIKKAKEELRNETYADIHMQEYKNSFMNTEPIKNHFCHYDKGLEIYNEQTHYLHPYHRQALINCNL